MNLGVAESPSQRRMRGRQTAGIREVSRMPKDGKNRRSGRDDPRGNDLVGGLGSDEDYDWIKYLGDGRSQSSPAASAQPAPQSPAQTATRPAAQSPMQPTARPAPLPQRARPDPEAGRARQAEPSGREERRAGYDNRQTGRQDAPPASGPVAGRAVKVRPG